MDQTIFNKMKVKDGQSAKVLYPPKEYPAYAETGLFFDEYLEQVQFVLLFVASKQEFEDRIELAKSKLLPNGLLWVSYPRCSGSLYYDINGDNMWDLSIPHGLHPVSQIALDDTWSAMRLAANKPGDTYQRPNNGVIKRTEALSTSL